MTETTRTHKSSSLFVTGLVLVLAAGCDDGLDDDSWSDESAAADESAAVEAGTSLDEKELVADDKGPVEVVSEDRLSFVACSAKEQADARRAVALARSYVDAALGDLERTSVDERATSPRYTAFFGSYTAERYAEVMDNYRVLDGALTEDPITFDCSCDLLATRSSAVFGESFTFDICPMFSELREDTGGFTQAGLLIDGLLQYEAVTGMDDQTLDSDEAQELASEDPEAAVRNANGYEHFAQNVEALGMSENESFSSETDGFWGEWGQQANCPSGQFVYGYRLRSESYQGLDGDDTALNDIELYCAAPNSTTYKRIWSAYMTWGTFSDPVYCTGGNNPVVAFDIRIEPAQGIFDDSAANDVDLYCKNDTMLSATVNTEWGDWSDKVQCPSGQAVTGLVTRVEDFQEPPFGDNSALNGVRMMCSAY
ncbi:VOMI family protein [Plesiocystis pacifica SIR-1]|uniref:VOMI family protein n=1 Tax=Plesiocystis pacifica SIR-1 TaxID=391625 RepID=A6G7T8_9BACT|nr:M35 family metallo-endopeptidase [Plesiocystis pacifica]EDM78031.1 VOMI family protein [Plesiocystis pacifica SIR-1]